MCDVVTIIAIFVVLIFGRETRLILAKARMSGWNDFPRS